METPKVRIVFLGGETQSEPDSSHLDAINEVLNQLHGNLIEEPEAEELRYQTTERDCVEVAIPDANVFGQKLNYFVDTNVAKYIAKLESQLDNCRSLDYSIDRVHISNK